MLNKIGLKTEPWGILKIIYSKENFEGLIRNSCVFNSAFNTSCGKVSEAFERSVNSALNAWLLSTACFHFCHFPTGSVVQYNPSKNILTFPKTFIQKYIRDKVFKNGLSKVCGRQPLKIWSNIVLLARPYPFKFFKGYLPQILLGSFLNTLSHIRQVLY